MSEFQDLTGQRFGKLTVLKRADDYISPSGHKTTRWLCKCDCGNQKIINSGSLKKGDSTSCGCVRRDKMRKIRSLDLTGRKFGRLTILYQAKDHTYPSGKHRLCWHCVCDCGNECDVLSNLLISGHTQSCGCKQKEAVRNTSDNNIIDLTGQKFNKLTVIKRAEDYVRLDGQHIIQWLCECDCGGHKIVRGSNLKTGNVKSCGCIVSCGETDVKCYLSNNNINYESQKMFDDLFGLGNGKLSYDFYVPNKKLLIECQGQQHENPIEIFGGEEQFAIQQEHDKRKREYAKKNGYKLLEIWYYDYDKIEEILSRELELD